MKRILSLAIPLVCLVPGLAFASVGKVSLLEGHATRQPRSGAPEALRVGAEVELGDRIRVQKDGNLKLTLNDSSVLMVGAGSELLIDEAEFEGQERKGFSAKLLFGKVWAKVSKALAGSESKFEIATERAVAGVRGTIFRVDAAKLLAAARPAAAQTTVRVLEGKVAVSARVRAPARKTPAAGARPSKGQRVQVQGPTEVTRREWEERFVELQARQKVEIGEELWRESSFDPGEDRDAFADFVKKHQ